MRSTFMPTTTVLTPTAEQRNWQYTINSKTKSGGKEMPGLVKRRQREVALYLHGEYGTLPKIG